MLTVEMLIYPQAAALDVIGPMDVFAAANIVHGSQGKGGAYQLVLSAANKGLVRTSSGVALDAHRQLGDGDGSDYLMVAGGLGFDSARRDAALIKRLEERAGRSSRLASVCTGAFLLAEAGLLDGRQCTTHWRFTEQLGREYPDLNVHPDAIYLQDGSISTSAGVTAGIDLALALVEQDYGAELALEVARDLVLYLRRPGSQSQFSAPLELRQRAGSDFSALHDWLLSDLQRPASVEDMAAFCCMSPRHFARQFNHVTGMTPARFLERLRLERARELLESTQMSSEAISVSAGFGREERLRRVFLKTLGVTPGIYRHHFHGTRA
ncbi:GlxA family transcriptional regulator [Pseudomaricurvus alkylphenolicus]|jgi:transcriptional regulator GlxA family with amidase domain|uniref:GlxA family transcriptional regulator n=1 Tax=Pseudomaricurvus alkylphenolicus TaxID=1306991 RepID=UPI0014220438|nr:GlxA family transcriptional regulator [Pseudomaricurvus alkylphenolicus]NIB41759.1 GlxA family transcriptional regulator [Pseudomaricurvus alkylphenolicus]